MGHMLRTPEPHRRQAPSMSPGVTNLRPRSEGEPWVGRPASGPDERTPSGTSVGQLLAVGRLVILFVFLRRRMVVTTSPVELQIAG